MHHFFKIFSGEHAPEPPCNSDQRAFTKRHTSFIVVQSLLKLLVITSIYLGLILKEFLDYNVTTKNVSQSAGRALGLLSKDKAFGGMPFECYSKCYDALVQSVINYGAAI